MTSKAFNVGVIGYGMSAKVFHIPFITTTPGLKLYAVVQRHPTEDNNVEKDYPSIKRYMSAEELVEDSAVDIVIVSTTPDVHYEQTKLALEAGKHVLLEKPFCPTYQECEDLISIAKEHNVLLSIYQNRRFDTDFLTLKKLVTEGSLGRIVDFETHFDRYAPSSPETWKAKMISGGGAIFDLGTHLLDQVIFLFGLPNKITAFIGTQRTRENNPNNFEDYFTVILHYESGFTATAKGSVISPEASQLRYWVRGDRGSYKKYHVDVQEPQLRFQGLKATDATYAKEPKEHYGVLTRVQADGSITSEVVPTLHEENYRTYYRNLAKALAGESGVPVPPDVPAQVIRLIELAKESSKSGRTIEV